MPGIKLGAGSRAWKKVWCRDSLRGMNLVQGFHAWKKIWSWDFLCGIKFGAGIPCVE